jgi:carboxypeptidase Taq
MNQAIKDFRSRLAEIQNLRAASAVIEWDQQTYMPAGGAEARARQHSTLSQLAHEHFVSQQFADALEQAESAAAALDPQSEDALLIRRIKREAEKSRRVPTEWVGRFSHETSLAQQVWQAARPKSDFAGFKPNLKRIIELRRQYTDFFAPFEHIYDPLLDDFEPGLKTTEVQAVFKALRPRQVELVQAITDRGSKVDDGPLYLGYDPQLQRQFALGVVRDFGYDLGRGRLDVSAHPFTTSFSVNDVRITTRYQRNYLNDALFSTLHESGHAMYGQGVAPSLDQTPLIEGSSLAIHESQSRMWENFVGRSLPFWKAYYPQLQQLFHSQLGDVKLESFYRAINVVKPSLIRTEADEATYNLHIMLRLELEIALLEGSLSVDDLPEAWDSRMQDYLGIKPPDNKDGVMQDVHWSGGMFGYFPTYALGNIMAAQLWEKIRQDLPDLDAQIERRQFGGLLGWLHDNIHVHGGLLYPGELLERATGSGLTYEPYLHYLQEKYSKIYRL